MLFDSIRGWNHRFKSRGNGETIFPNVEFELQVEGCDIFFVRCAILDSSTRAILARLLVN